MSSTAFAAPRIARASLPPGAAAALAGAAGIVSALLALAAHLAGAGPALTLLTLIAAFFAVLLLDVLVFIAGPAPLRASGAEDGLGRAEEGQANGAFAHV